MTAARKQNKTLFSQYKLSTLANQNHVLDTNSEQTKAKNIKAYSVLFQDIVSSVSKIITANQFPVVLAGDHGSAAATVSAMKIAAPEKRLGVVWIDAHADLHSPYTTPSGNIHGMPLSIPLNSDNLDCQVNEIPNEIASLWNNLKSVGGIAPKILSEDLIYVGVRDTEEQEDYLINKWNIKNFTVDEVRNSSPEKIGDEILRRLSACDWIYLTFDVDSMDPDESSYGTGTPVKNGLKANEAKQLILHMLKSGRVGCFEMVEVNPCLDDKGNKMAEIALEIIEESIKIIEDK
jgi:arginase